MLPETAKYCLSFSYEEIYLLSKANDVTYHLGSIYGNPNCGLIDRNENWCIAAGEHAILWHDGKLFKINDSIKWVHDIKQAGINTVQFLIDPFSENAAIWELNVLTLETYKLSDFNKYKDQEYNEDIQW